MKKKEFFIEFIEEHIGRELYIFERGYIEEMLNRVPGDTSHVCEMCGENISGRYSTTRFCYSCARKRKNAKRKLQITLDSKGSEKMKKVIMDGVTYNEILLTRLEDMEKNGIVPQEDLVRQLHLSVKMIKQQNMALLIAEKAIGDLADAAGWSEEKKTELFTIIGRSE